MLFLTCGALATFGGLAVVMDSSVFAAAVIGIAFTGSATNTLAALTMVVGLVTVGLATLYAMSPGLEHVRWTLGAIGVLVSLYYLYAIVWLLSGRFPDEVVLPLVAWALWTAATVLVLREATRNRRYQGIGFRP